MAEAATLPAPSTVRLEEGDKAPDFNNITTDGGEQISLSDFAGKNIVLYFYPKDDTPGCTKEAQAFRDAADEFAKLNTVILGVSADDSASHDKFKQKYDLNFKLIADTELEICQKYGTWVEKNRFGKTSLGIARATFIIDAEGVIRKLWRAVKVDGHAEKVHEFIAKKLQ